MSEEQTKKCPKCKEEILKSAKKCKHCGSSLEGWFDRHKILTIFFILLLIVIMRPGSDANNVSNNQNGAAMEQVHKIGEDFLIGHFNYNLGKVEQKSSVGDQYSSSKASGVYEVCYLSIINGDKEPRYADSAMFKIIDDQNRSFAVSTDATTAYSITYGSKYDLFLKQANPGVQIDGVLVFDIPKDAKGLKLEVSGGFGSPETAYIQIN